MLYCVLCDVVSFKWPWNYQQSPHPVITICTQFVHRTPVTTQSCIKIAMDEDRTVWSRRILISGDVWKPLSSLYYLIVSLHLFINDLSESWCTYGKTLKGKLIFRCLSKIKYRNRLWVAESPCSVTSNHYSILRTL